MPKQPKRLELRLLPVDEVDVPQLAAVRAGRRAAIGKRFDADVEAYVPTGEPETVVLVGDDIARDLPHYAAACRQGELRPADDETAKALGVAVAPSAGAPAGGARDLAKEVAASPLSGPPDSLPPPLGTGGPSVFRPSEPAQSGPLAQPPAGGASRR